MKGHLRQRDTMGPVDDDMHLEIFKFDSLGQLSPNAATPDVLENDWKQGEMNRPSIMADYSSGATRESSASVNCDLFQSDSDTDAKTPIWVTNRAEEVPL